MCVCVCVCVCVSHNAHTHKWASNNAYLFTNTRHKILHLLTQSCDPLAKHFLSCSQYSIGSLCIVFVHTDTDGADSTALCMCTGTTGDCHISPQQP